MAVWERARSSIAVVALRRGQVFSLGLHGEKLTATERTATGETIAGGVRIERLTGRISDP